MKAKKFWALSLACAVAFSAMPSAAVAAESTSAANPSGRYSMNLEDYNGHWAYNETYDCYELLNVVYCENPENADYEALNIYIPAGYVKSCINGTITFLDSAKINGYRTDNAPIIYCNGASGWAAKKCTDVTLDRLSNKNLELDYKNCIKNGFVLIGAGSRGSASQNADGNYDGKSPNNITDIKAGLRFIRHNDSYLPGTNERIVSAGTSGGGGMSAILGASGNSADYNSYLKDIGALMEEEDTVLGDMCYCPISDLDNADMGYAWMYQNPESLISRDFMTGSTTEIKFTDFQKTLNGDLASAYENYILSLNLDSRYADNFDNYAADIAEMFEQSYEKYLTVTFGTDTQSAAEDASQYSWMTYSEASGNVTISGENGRAKLDTLIENGHNTRSKSIPGFDIFDGSLDARAECHLFGTNFTTTDTGHFSKSLATLLIENDNTYSTLDGYADYTKAYAPALTDKMQQRAKMLNPMYYIQDYIKGDKNIQPAEHFRLLVGSKDSNTTPTVVFNLGKLIEKAGIDVEYAYIWNQGHGTRDYENEFVTWVNEIAKSNTNTLTNAIKSTKALTQNDYTAESWNRLQTALKSAVEVSADSKASQAAVDNAVSNLNAAVKALVKKGTSVVTLKNKTVKYTGKAISIGKAAVKGSTGRVTYTYYSDKACKKALKSAPKSAGTYYVRAAVAADANYKAATSNIAKLTIQKAAQKIKVQVTSKTIRKAKVKKAKQIFSIKASAKGKLSYKKVSGSKKLSISKTSGKITVKKGTPKGTYKIKVKVSAKSTGNYASASTTKTITIKVK